MSFNARLSLPMERIENMKKLSLLLALALVAALLVPAALAATSGSCGKYITWKYTAGSGNNGYGATLTLTGFGDMYDYASKGAPWYSNAQKITHIVINSTEYGIRSIGNYAFQGIYTSDISPIPDTVISIGDYAFYGNYAIQSLELPAGLTHLGEGAFYGCSGLRSIVIPDGITAIGAHCFHQNTFLESVTLPSNLQSIGEQAFVYCTTLTGLSLPASVTQIDEGAFAYCKDLSAIEVEAGNPCFTSVNGVLFNSDCTELIRYPGGKPGTEYVVPATVAEIAPYAFSDTQYLKSVTLPEGLAEIKKSTFASHSKEGFTALTHVDIPASVTTIRNGAFSICLYLKDLVLPNGVTTIESSAFWGSGLTHITIPPTAVSIDGYAFAYCKDDMVIRAVADSYAVSYAGTDHGTNTPKNIVVEYIFPYGGDRLVLPENLTAIEESTFEGIDASVVVIPDGVTIIGSRAFAACPNLKHVSVPDSVTRIVSDAFDGCGTVYLYGTKGGTAQDYSKDHGNINFISLNP